MDERQYWRQRIKDLRAQLKLTQQLFAGRLGFAPMSVSHWELGKNTPTAVHAAVLELLASVLRTHPPAVVLRALTETTGDLVGMLRALVWLDLHPPEPPHRSPRYTTARPPFSAHVLSGSDE